MKLYIKKLLREGLIREELSDDEMNNLNQVLGVDISNLDELRNALEPLITKGQAHFDTEEGNLEIILKENDEEHMTRIPVRNETSVAFLIGLEDEIRRRLGK